MLGYRRTEWLEFRDQMIKLHGGACGDCGRGPDDGVVLQVHHTRYVPGRLPWQYGFDECEVLCRGCHGREHGLLRPSFGWHLLGYSDLGDLSRTCDLCGTDLRYVFLVDHPKWESMEVGEECCDNLTCGTEARTHMESVRRYTTRLKRFVSSVRWERTPRGLHIRQKKIDLEVRRDGDAFRLMMNGIVGRMIFSSTADAQMKAFELIESGVAASFLAEARRTRRQSLRRGSR